MAKLLNTRRIELDETSHSDTEGISDAEISEVKLNDNILNKQHVVTKLEILHCPSCLITFSERTRSFYEKHIQICGKGTFPCFLCTKKFSSKSVLKRHINIHLKIKAFICKTCSSEFSTQFTLVQHVERVHKSGKSEMCACRYCGKAYKWPSSLSRHIMEKHCSNDSSPSSTMAFQCVCGQKFPSYYFSYKHKKSCDDYIKNIVENDIKVKQFPVDTKIDRDVINKSTFTVGLHNEIVLETGEMAESGVSADQTSVTIGHTEDNESSQKHKCQFCNTIFTQRQDLEDHVDSCDPFDVSIVQDWLCAKMGVEKNRQNKPGKSDKDMDLSIENDVAESTMFDSGVEISQLETKDPDVIVKQQSTDEIAYTVKRTRRKRKAKDFTGYETDPRYTNTSNDVSESGIMLKTEYGNLCEENLKEKDELCDDLGNASGIMEEVRNVGTSSMFFCPVCYIGDEDVNSIHDHIKRVHEADDVSWSLLSKTYMQMSGVNIDPASLINDTETVCRYCKVDCQSTEELKLHVNQTHASLPFCCGICRLAYSSVELMKLHMRQYHLKTSLCLICKKTFMNTKDLKSHIRLIHGISQDPLPVDRNISERYILSKYVLKKKTLAENNTEEKKANCRKNVRRATDDHEHWDKPKAHGENIGTKRILIKQTVEADDCVEHTIHNEGHDEQVESENSIKLKPTNVMHCAPPIIKSAVVIPKAYGTECEQNGAGILDNDIVAVKEGKNNKCRTKCRKIGVRHRKSNQSSVKVRKGNEVTEGNNNQSNGHTKRQCRTEVEDDSVDGDIMDDVVTIEDHDTNGMPDNRQLNCTKKQSHETILINDRSHIRFDFSGITDSEFRCSFKHCGLHLPNYVTWKSHLSTHISGKGNMPITCLECRYSTQSKRILKEHLLIKHNLLQTVEISLKHCQFVKRSTGSTVKVIACVFCGFLTDIDHFSTEHIQCFRLKLNFFCPFCPKKDADFELMQDHIKAEHAHETIHGIVRTEQYETLQTCERDPAYSIDSCDTNCQRCQAEFSSNRELKLHANEKHAICPYSCGVCRLCYGRLSGVMCHMKRTHTLPLKCRQCSRGFGDKSDLNRHEATHLKTKPYLCDLCTCSYADQKALKTHFVHKHAQKWKDVGSNKGKVHTSEEESELELYICDLCGLRFDSHKEYKSHASIHRIEIIEQVPVVKCDMCSKIFTKKKYSRHLCTNVIKGDEPTKMQGYVDNEQSIRELYQKIKQNVTHGLGTKVKCGLCGKQFNKTKYLYGHIRTMHLPDEGKSFHCQICRKGFTRKLQLEIHMRTHSDSKPYRCRICSKSYRQLAHIREHLLSHSGKPSFPCRMCPQVFKTRSSLARHTRIHCNVYPFECLIKTCVKKFADLPNFVLHFRRCASRQNTSDHFVCNLCSKEIKGLKNSLIHMKSHRKDKLYKCDACSEECFSFAQLYKHKVAQNHLTKEEQEGATDTVSKAQFFKCTEVSNSIDLDVLQQQFDYTPDVIPDEIIGDIPNESKPEGEIDYSDDETIVENVGNTDILMDIAEQLTYMASNNLLNEEQTGEIAECDEQVIEVTTDAPVRKRLENTLIEQVNESKHTHDGIAQENSVCEINENVKTFNTDNNQTYAIHTIENEAQETSLNDQNVEVENEDQQGKDDVINEKLLESSMIMMILDEFGKEVRVNIMSETGCKIPIQSNPELLQTLLGTEKYTLHYTQSTSNIEEYAKAASDLEEHTISFTSIEESPKLSNDIDTCVINRTFAFENEAEVEGMSNVYITNEVQSEDGAHRYIPSKRKTQERSRNLEQHRKIMNFDKVCGEITDKEANIGNQKSSDGHVNYKVSLRYYEDRTNQKELYPLQCDMCKRRYKRTKDLNLHKRTHLPNDQKAFQCVECGRGFTTRDAFRNHSRLHSGERPFECVQCDKRFRQLGHLQTHLRQHANYRPFKCLLCDDRAFVTNSQLTKHVLTHKESAYAKDGIPCKVCGDVLANEKQAHLHQIKHISTETRNEILSKFNLLKGEELPEQSEEGDNDHISVVKQFIHGNHMCDVCGKMFARQADLKVHNEIHQSGPKVACKECGKEYQTEKRLRVHITKSHSGEGCQCDLCGIQLKNKSSWYSHKKSHGEPQFQCSHCKKSFVKKDAFFYHFSSCIGDDFIQKLQMA